MKNIHGYDLPKKNNKKTKTLINFNHSSFFAYAHDSEI